MEITPETVVAERDRLLEHAPVVIGLVNETRDRLGTAFDTDVAHVTVEQYRGAVETVFADGDRAVNVAGYAAVLRNLDVQGDYPGFVVDEVIGRALAATIAGGQPLGTLAEATFHYVDATTHGDDEAAGVDDLDAALAAGFQTRLPGWQWREEESPFAVPPASNADEDSRGDPDSGAGSDAT